MIRRMSAGGRIPQRGIGDRLEEALAPRCVHVPIAETRPLAVEPAELRCCILRRRRETIQGGVTVELHERPIPVGFCIASGRGRRSESLTPCNGWNNSVRRTRGRLVPGLVLWTLVMLIVAIALATEAMLSLNQAEQACFFNFPATPCPAADDPALTRLTMAFVGVPLAWGIGLVVIGLVWSLARRDTSRHRGSRG